MGILQMSLYGSVMIAVVVLIRTALVNHVPKRTFIVLWCVVLVRLLIPFEISSDYSVYSLIGYDVAELVQNRAGTGAAGEADTGLTHQAGAIDQTGKQVGENADSGAIRSSAADGVGGTEQAAQWQYGDGEIQASAALFSGGEMADASAPEKGRTTAGKEAVSRLGALFRWTADKVTNMVNYMDHTVVRIFYGIGAALCAVYFVILYVRCRSEFGMSLPVTDAYVQGWLEERRRFRCASSILAQFRGAQGKRLQLRPAVTARVSDRIDTPLTYGVIRPVILLPKKTMWEGTEQLKYVLWHEYTHICYGDSVLKLFAAAALCAHWFNPMVWSMYYLLNRDIELACDESVVHRCGVDDKSAYADMLIAMAAKRSGLVPFGSNFSQNAIEERVRAIMKIKKISIGAVVFAAGMVLGVTTAFATSAENREERIRVREDGEMVEVTDQVNVIGRNIGTDFKADMDDEAMIPTNEADYYDHYTVDEWDMFYALQFDGYEEMTVSEFQDKVWTLTDMREYRWLLDRLEKDEAMYAARGTDKIADFLFNVLEPLTAESWQEREFGGAVSVSGADAPLQENKVYDMAVLEYVMTLTILDADTLTVDDYTAARLEMADRISNMMLDYTAEELADEEWMLDEIESRLYELTAELSTEALRVDVDEWFYQPLDPFYMEGSSANAGQTHTDGGYGNAGQEYVDGGYQQSPEEWEQSLLAEEQALHETFQAEVQDELAVVLQPYLPLGLTYEYDAQADDFKMYFKGREVRGIIDEYQGTFIAAHTGISQYAKDATEVYAVYDEQGNLTGLRAATGDEQEEWNLRRRQSTASLRDVSEEVREYLPGTSEDYDQILSLKKANYEKMSLADFDSALLDWANAHSDSYDRIECDRIWDDFRVNLSEEDRAFVTRTIRLSGLENAMTIRSLYNGKSAEEAEDVSIEGTLTKDPGEGAPQYAWCQMFYLFRYHVNDKEKVTVGERDRAVGGMLDGIEDFWEQADIEELLKMDKSDIMKKLNELAAKNSTRNIRITAAGEDRIGYERMDERSSMQE